MDNCFTGYTPFKKGGRFHVMMSYKHTEVSPLRGDGVIAYDPTRGCCIAGILDARDMKPRQVGKTIYECWQITGAKRIK